VHFWSIDRSDRWRGTIPDIRKRLSKALIGCVKIILIICYYIKAALFAYPFRILFRTFAFCECRISEGKEKKNVSSNPVSCHSPLNSAVFASLKSSRVWNSPSFNPKRYIAKTSRNVFLMIKDPFNPCFLDCSNPLPHSEILSAVRMKIVGMFAGEHSSLEPSSNSACQTFASVEIVAGKRQTNFNKDPYARIVLKIDPSAHAIVKESSGMTRDYSIARRLVNRKQFADCTISLLLSIFILVLFLGPRVFETLRTLRSDFHTDIGRRKKKERRPDYSTSHQSIKRSIIRATWYR